MYENEIRDLKQLLRNGASNWSIKALDTAIALMRSAEPKDAAAEREHCKETVRMSWPRAVSDWEQECLTALLMRERAAARAELRALVEFYKREAEAAYNAGYEDGRS